MIKALRIYFWNRLWRFQNRPEATTRSDQMFIIHHTLDDAKGLTTGSFHFLCLLILA